MLDDKTLQHAPHEKRLAGGGGAGRKAVSGWGRTRGSREGRRKNEGKVAGAVLQHPCSGWLQELSKRIWMEAKTTGSTASAGMSS